MTDVYATARQMLDDLGRKRVSARELLASHLARNDVVAKKLNAVVASEIALATAAAQGVDDARARGETLGVLAGLPMTVKDAFDVQTMPAVCGNPALKDRAKDCADADVVAAARRAGAVIWGKTNVPKMAGDMQTYNEVYGTTNNPYDLTRTCGGSSGGSAVALAAGITPLEIGSDIGGSLRHPANFCGVCSLKPTWNLLSQRGHIPPPPGSYVAHRDVNVVGPMARNIGDLRLLFGAIGGSTGSRRDVRGLRLALCVDEPGLPLAAEVRSGIENAAKDLEAQGVVVERTRLPFDVNELIKPYISLLLPIVAADLPEDEFRAMLSLRESDLKAVQDGASLFSMESYRVLSGASFREVQLAQQERQIRDRLAAFFAEGWSGILMPIDPTVAFPHLQTEPFVARELDIDGVRWPYFGMASWIAIASALHAPAICVAAGRTGAGLPVNAQIVGAWNTEQTLFDLAAALEEANGGFVPPAL